MECCSASRAALSNKSPSASRAKESPWRGHRRVIKTRNLNAAIKVKEEMMRAGSRDGVADIAALVRQLARVEKLAEGSVGSAEFGLQMIRMPEEQAIEWA